MNCQDLRERLMDLVSGVLPEADRGAAEAHLAGCPACRAERALLEAQEARLRAHFRSLRGGLAGRVVPRLGGGGAPRRLRPGFRLGAAAALLLAVGFWALRPGGGPAPVYGDIQVLKKGFTVTVFNRDLGLIRDHRQILNLRPGPNRFRFEDVPGLLDPRSVRFRSETDPAGCRVLEQAFEYDLLSREKLLSRYVDRELSFERKNLKTKARERLRGTLLSAEGAVRMASGEVLPAFPGEPVLPELPGGLLTRPALAWTLDAPKESRHDTTVAYLTGGMSWKADYLMTLRGPGTLDLDGWVSVTNESGAGYPEAQLKLIAGDPHRAPDEPLDMLKVNDALEDDEDGKKAQGLAEKSFFEYHLYTLERPTTLADRETKQVGLLSARGVPFRTEHVYEPARDPRVGAFLVFTNSRENRVGMPLPAGTVRIMAPDLDGEAEQVALAALDHTPRDEEVRIPRGAAFDLAAERKLKQVFTAARRVSHDVEIRLRNHGDRALTVEVRERLEGDWTVTKQTHPHQRKDAETAVFQVEVPSGGEALLQYAWERPEREGERPRGLRLR